MVVTNTKLHSFFLFLSLLVLSASFVLATDETLHEVRRDPQREQQYQECQQQCRHQQGSEQRECRKRCEDRYGYGIIPLNTERRDPEREYQQCQQQCRQQPPGQQQQLCQHRCQEQHRQEQQQEDPQREYQQCQQQCRQQQGEQRQQCQERCQERYQKQQDVPLLNADERQDPEREYQQCKQQCRQQPGQQQQCQQRCEERYAQQRQQRDPQRECQQQCRQQAGQQQQQQCQERCQERYQQQQDVALMNAAETQDPEREHQQCQQQCRQQPGQQQQQCQQRCEERYAQQRQDPQREYQQCQQHCRQQQGQQQQECQQRCQERYQQQQDVALMKASETQDPEREYQQCQQQCRRQPGQQQQQCQQRCEERYAQQRQQQDPQREYQQCQQQCRQQPGQQEQQCQRRCQEEYGRQPNPHREYHQCQQECRRQQGQQQEQCQQRCEEQYGEQQREYQQCQQQCRRQQGQQQQRRCQERCEEQLEGKQGERGYEWESRGEQQRGLEEDENPYLFRQERFITRVRSQEGNIRVLERFAQRSNLLEGIDNYRVAMFEANPRTFLTPHHYDADTICVVLNGRGSITFLQENNKETHNVERGDIFRIPAGTTVYSVNRDNNEKLYTVDITVPVNTPGEFESFFAAGGRDQESFFNAFSDEVLEAAFNTESDELRKMFQGQNKERFVRASEEQIRALSGQSSEHGAWPFRRGGESQSRRPYNLFNQRPTQSNRYGQLYEANPDDYQQLEDLDLAVSFANITKGAMIGPYYNSRSTKIAMVVSGNGYIEMACPHLSQQQGQGGRWSQRAGYRGSGSSTSYQKVSARVSRGDVFVVPAGHPIVTVASENQNLQVVCFEINAQNNQRYQLAGNNNILKQLERVAKELSFNVPATQVDDIFNKQQESYFFPGPQQRQQQYGAHHA